MHHHAKKSLGQNFLVDVNYQQKIANAVREAAGDQTVVEIGPGQGAITRHLRGFAKKLVLVEKDYALAKNLTDSFAGDKIVDVKTGDFLELETDLFTQNMPSVAVGNLPYNVASQILIKLIEMEGNFTSYFLMFQREMAERIVASPNSKDYSVLSVWAQLFTKPKILFHLPPSVFRPQPRVQSSFVRFDVLGLAVTPEKKFIEFIKKLFGQRRKKISTILKLKDEKNPMLDLRVEALSLTQMRKLFEYYEASRASSLP